MSSPHSADWVIWLVAMCWPAPGTVLVVALLTTAIIKRWIKVKVDTSNAPKLNWRRND